MLRANRGAEKTTPTQNFRLWRRTSPARAAASASSSAPSSARTTPYPARSTEATRSPTDATLAS